MKSEYEAEELAHLVAILVGGRLASDPDVIADRIDVPTYIDLAVRILDDARETCALARAELPPLPSPTSGVVR